jgi:hypothetical protein
MARTDATSKKKDIVVLIVRRDTQCSDCDEELGSGSFIYLENRQALCLSCADLDYLDYLPSGNAALTRRAKKHSRIHAVVVRWSRARKRYERQGILAAPEAIQRAEEECLADAEFRKARRQREQLKRTELDRKYVTQFASEIRKVFPSCPATEEVKIAQHACRKYSGRVGRSAAAKHFDSQTIALAVQAHIRHAYTNYDALLMEGWERIDARGETHAKVEEILNRWQTKRGQAANNQFSFYD